MHLQNVPMPWLSFWMDHSQPWARLEATTPIPRTIPDCHSVIRMTLIGPLGGRGGLCRWNLRVSNSSLRLTSAPALRLLQLKIMRTRCMACLVGSRLGCWLAVMWLQYVAGCPRCGGFWRLSSCTPGRWGTPPCLHDHQHTDPRRDLPTCSDAQQYGGPCILRWEARGVDVGISATRPCPHEYTRMRLGVEPTAVGKTAGG